LLQQQSWHHLYVSDSESSDDIEEQSDYNPTGTEKKSEDVPDVDFPYEPEPPLPLQDTTDTTPTITSQATQSPTPTQPQTPKEK
jgi:hypothetical protein